MSDSDPGNSFDTEDPISERAADFYQRRRFWDWSEGDQAELDAWFAASLWHRAAYLRMEGIANRAEQLRAARLVWLDCASESGKRSTYRQFLFPLLAAASVALVVGLGFPFARHLMRLPDRTYSTDIGGRTLLSFTDHTQIELNTNTVARFRMTNVERTVWLEKGEAWFHVAHNAASPFTVIVGKHRVTDLGTEFLVRRDAGGMEVALVSGRATLSTEGAPVATLTPGDDAVATQAALSVTRKTPVELADELAWRRGVLVFRDARLADAVREFNRYNQTKLVIADPSIADLKFSAEIKDDNYEGFVLVAETMLSLRADRQGHDIYLSRELPEKRKKGARTKRGL